MAKSTSTGRRVDPQRRDRLLQGVMDTIADHGVEGLTHRRVATAAGASLSATTYYFGSIEEMLEAALCEAVERDLKAFTEQFADVAPQNAPAMLVSYMENALNDRRGLCVQLELYSAALRREPLRKLVLAWEEAVTTLLVPSVGKRAAPAVNTAICGGLFLALIRGGEGAADQAIDSVRALLEALGVSSQEAL